MNTHVFNQSTQISQRKIALVAGISSLILAAAAMVAEFYARQQLIVPHDAAATAQRVIAGQASFRIGVFGFAISLICDLVISWAMYVFMKQSNKQLSLLTAWFRLVYTVLFALAVVELVNGFQVLTDGNLTAVLEQDQVNAFAMEHFQAFDNAWTIGFLFFGVHLVLLGYLAVKSRFVPRIIGVLVFIAGVAYFSCNLAKLLLPNYEAYAAIFTSVVAIPSIIGELSLAIWLVVKGGKRIV
jgi:hypothetical protein